LVFSAFGWVMTEIDKGREQTEQMFALIGKAITNWSFVEEQLCHVFEICAGPVSTRPDGGHWFLDSVPSAVFYSVENFRGKLSLIDAALNARAAGPWDWAQEIRADWARLRDKARKLSLKRNKLAHWTVLPGYDYEGTIPPRLVPPIGSPNYYRATGLSGKLTLQLQHLSHLNHAFFLLQQKIRDFTVCLGRREELFDKYVEQLAHQVRSHCHSDPSRAERLERALSSPEIFRRRPV
jgi:hypothetical protein